MRLLAALVLLVSVPASAQTAISGTFSAAYQGFNAFGVPLVKLTLSLQCSLTCDASAPTKSFAVRGLADATFASAPAESTGSVSVSFASDVYDDGFSEAVSESFSAGSAFVVHAKSVSCQCGNRTGEGGYINLDTQTVAVPPWFSGSSFKAGFEQSGVVAAKPRGSETVQVQLQGAGLGSTQTFSAADYGTESGVFVRFTPTAAGTLTVTSTLLPHGASHVRTFEVTAGSSGSGGGSGGSGGGDGTGGSGGGGEGGFGCASVPAGSALPLLLALAGLARRRRR